jgi:branched-chain amino acid transport system substrate-binding protein
MKKFALGLVCLTFLLNVGMAGAQEKREKIQYAYLGPLTGSAAALGAEQWAGVQLAVKDINSAGGIKVGGKAYEFEAHDFDVEESPERSVTKMNEALSLYHPRFFYGASSMTGIPLKQFAKDKGFIMVAMSEVPGYTEPLNPLCIRGWMKVSDQGPMLDYMRKQGINKLGLLAHSGEVSVKWAEVCKGFWEKREGKVVGEVTYPVESTDFTSPVTKLLSSNPDAIASGGNPDVRAANILKIARELGFKGKFFFGGACRGPRMLGLIGKDLAEGTLLVGTEWEKGSPKIDAFKKRLETLYPGKPYGFIFVVAYEPLFMMKAAMEKAGTVTDINKIAAAMDTAVTPQTSAAGLFTKVVKGEVELNLYPVEIRNGQLVAVK